MSFHRQLSLQSILLIQSNRIHLSRPPTPIRNFQYSRPGPISKKGVRDRTRGPISNRCSGTEQGLQYRIFRRHQILGEDFLLHMYLYSSLFHSRSCRIDMGVFPSAEVREYAYDGLYSMVYLGIGPPNHVTSHRLITCLMMWRRLRVG